MSGIDLNNLCLGCMEEKAGAFECPYCGWVEGSASESVLHLPPGTVLQEKYLIGKALGQGGFGVTYLAWDLNLKLKLAVKEYLPQELAFRTSGQNIISIYKESLADDFNYGLEKFLEEARTLAQFNEHPNIVSIRDFFKANGTAYLVMSHIEGYTLKEYLLSIDKPLTYDQALNIFIPALDALKEVHAADILHRDFSPDNLLVDSKGRVVLIDFGAARRAIVDRSRSMSVIMKAGYSPIEQYQSKGKQGPWTDIYAVAATFYHAITGQMPPEPMDRLDEDPLVAPSQLGTEITRNQEQTLLKAMALKAEDRFQSVNEFQEALLGENLVAVEKSSGAIKAEDEITKKPSFGGKAESINLRENVVDSDSSLTDRRMENYGYYHDYQKAGIWKRVGAFFLDAVIISQVPLAAVMVYTFFIMDHAEMNISTSYVFFYGLLIIPYAWMILYILLRDGFSNGQSWGKRLFNIMVVRLKDNKPCTIGNSIARNFMYLILSFIEVIVLLVHNKGQRLGDLIVNTQVIEVDDYKRTNPAESLMNNKIAPFLKEIKYIVIFVFIGFILFSGLRLVIGSTEPSYDHSLDYGIATFTIGTAATDKNPDIILSDRSYWEDVNYIDWIKVDCPQHELIRIEVEDEAGEMKNIPVIPNGMPLYYIFFADNYYAMRDIALPDPFRIKLYVQKDGKSFQGERNIEVRIHNYLDSYPGETDLSAVGQTSEIDVLFHESKGSDST